MTLIYPARERAGGRAWRIVGRVQYRADGDSEVEKEERQRAIVRYFFNQSSVLGSPSADCEPTEARDADADVIVQFGIEL